MVVPVYFFNQWLIQKIRPRESGKKLLAYFMITILASFIYISAGVFLVIRLAKYL